MLQRLAPEMSKLPPMGFCNRLVEFFQEIQASRGDAGPHYASIFRQSRPGDKATALQAVEQPGHIGIPSDETLSNLAAEKAMGVPTP